MSGSQPLSVCWLKDGVELLSGARLRLQLQDSSAALHITGLQQSDAGLYTCRASNAAGHKETSGLLSVRGQKNLQA